jgi:cellulose synthase (UDP-forming)
MALQTTLVAPPADYEVYWYLGPQKRWVQLCMAAAFLLAGVSFYRFARGTPLLWPLLLVLAVNVAGSGIAMISAFNKRRISRTSHDALIAAYAPADYPSVDVFLPTAGEDLAVLANTYKYVRKLEWTGSLTIWVLDDGDRNEVRELALAHGFRYLVRPDRGRLKKAGNLRYAYTQSHGEHIAIFDADFCPRADFLTHLVPYMSDPGVGIVQSPQVFDTTSQMNWLQRGSGATQELFYRWIQPSRDRDDAPICVGTCAVYRRSALEAIGGFAQIEHSEDVHTGIALLRAGYVTRYVPVLVSKGLCPDDVAGFLNQQYRWCNGSMTLLHSGTASTQPLRIRQRICFWAGFMYYIGTAINVFAVHVPGTVMAFFLPGDVRAANYIPFLGGVWVYFVLLPTVSRSKWRFEVLRVQMLYSYCHAMALFHKVIGRTADWVPTGALGRSSTLARSISRLGLISTSSGLALSWAGIAYAVPQYGLAQFWPMIVFTAGYTYLTGPVTLAFWRVLHPRAVTREVIVDLRSSGVAVPVEVTLAIAGLPTPQPFARLQSAEGIR